MAFAVRGNLCQAAPPTWNATSLKRRPLERPGIVCKLPQPCLALLPKANGTRIYALSSASLYQSGFRGRPVLSCRPAGNASRLVCQAGKKGASTGAEVNAATRHSSAVPGNAQDARDEFEEADALNDVLVQVLARNNVRRHKQAQEEPQVASKDSGAWSALQGDKPAYEDPVGDAAAKELAKARATLIKQLDLGDSSEESQAFASEGSTLASTSPPPAGWTRPAFLQATLAWWWRPLLIAVAVLAVATPLFQYLRKKLTGVYKARKKQEEMETKMERFRKRLAEKQGKEPRVELVGSNVPVDPEDEKLNREVEQELAKAEAAAVRIKAATERKDPTNQKSHLDYSDITVSWAAKTIADMDTASSDTLKGMDRGKEAPSSEDPDSAEIDNRSNNQAGASSSKDLFVPDYGKNAEKLERRVKKRKAEDIVIGTDPVNGKIYSDGTTEAGRAIRAAIEHELAKDPRLRGLHLKVEANKKEGKEPTDGLMAWEVQALVSAYEKGEQVAGQLEDEWLSKELKKAAVKNGLNPDEARLGKEPDLWAQEREKAEFERKALEANGIGKPSVSSRELLERVYKMTSKATRPVEPTADKVPELSHTQAWLEERRRQREDEERKAMEKEQPLSTAASEGEWSHSREWLKQIRERQSQEEAAARANGKFTEEPSPQTEWKEQQAKPKDVQELAKFLYGKAPKGTTVVAADPQEFFGDEEDDIPQEDYDWAAKKRAAAQAKLGPDLSRWQAEIAALGRDKFIDQRGEELGINWYSKKSEKEREKDRNWWKTLPYVSTILVGYGDQESEFALDLSGGKGSYHILGFQSSEDAKHFAAWLTARRPAAGPIVKPIGVKELSERAELAELQVTVVKRGELKLDKDTSDGSLIESLVEIAQDPLWIKQIEEQVENMGGMHVGNA